jgi:ATP-dependent Clp protease ATP-binding subunit ClpA
LIQIEVKDVLADEILFGRLREGGRVHIDRAGASGVQGESVLSTEHLVFEFQKMG